MIRCAPTASIAVLLTAVTLSLASPAQAVEHALADAKTLPAADAPYTRYLWVARPSRALRAAFRLHINLLSRSGQLADVTVVKPNLWRLDLRRLKVDPGTWEAGAEVDVYFHVKIRPKEDLSFKRFWPGGVDHRDGKVYKQQVFVEEAKVGVDTFVAAPWLPTKAIVDLRTLLYSESPILEAQQVLAYSRNQINIRNDAKSGFGYYDWLGIKKRDDYFAIAKLHIKDSEEIDRHVRAALEKSGVSPQNRQIVEYQALTGRAYATLDTSKQFARGVALRFLDPKDYKHDAEEWYVPLPNGLPLMGIFNNEGVRQDNAPADTHGFGNTASVNRSRDIRIHVGGACCDCHAGQILMPFEDDVRKTFKAGGFAAFGAVDYDTMFRLEKIWFRDIYASMEQARKDYREAVRLATVTEDYPEGLEAGAAMRAYAHAYYDYTTEDITPFRAAQEMGVSLKAYMAALKLAAVPPTTGKPTLIDTPLGRHLLARPLPMSRLTWEETYPLAWSYMASYIASGGKAWDE